MPRLPIHFDQPRGRRERGGQRRVLLILYDNETPGVHGAATSVRGFGVGCHPRKGLSGMMLFLCDMRDEGEREAIMRIWTKTSTGVHTYSIGTRAQLASSGPTQTRSIRAWEGRPARRGRPPLAILRESDAPKAHIFLFGQDFGHSHTLRNPHNPIKHHLMTSSYQLRNPHGTVTDRTMRI